MSMQFHEPQKLICWWPGTKMTKIEIKDYYMSLDECAWGGSANRFCDFSEVTEFAFDYSGLAQMANFRKKFLTSHKGIMLVIASTTPLGYGMGRMYQSLMHDWNMDIHVVGSAEKAAELLGVDKSLLSKP